MRAMVLSKPAPIESFPLQLRDAPEPVPGPHEARILIHCCAICRTDLHVVEGDLAQAKMPVIPGHQIVGTVDQLGERCARLRLGARVGVAWLRHTCGVCRFCTSDRENLCEQSQYTGYTADGGYAQYAIVPEDFAYQLPSQFNDVDASPLLCAGIIGYRAMKRSQLKDGEKLAIFGMGSSAHIVLQLAVHRGCEAFVVSRSANHQKLARDLGASWAGSDASQMPAKVGSAIVFAPVGTVVPAALQSLDRGGVCALAGIHMSVIPSLDYDRDLFQERDLHPVTANTRNDAIELLDAAAKAGVKPHTTTYPLADANRALADMKAGRIDGTGVLIVRDA
jgi:alcohol dehydrogenase, propanol-preferring